MDVRDLSFRAKRIDGEGWAYGDYINGSDTLGYIDDSLPGGCACYAVHPSTLGMYTGFQDSNGLRIYDGDILKLVGSYGETDGSMQEFEETREVIYKHGCFYGYNFTEFPHWTPLFEIAEEIDIEIIEKIEIVGNIHYEGGTR